MTRKNNIYLSIISELKVSTNLTRIQNNLKISKQNLNNYLRELQKHGYVSKKGRGWYELTEKSKNMTSYDSFLSKDFIRGHAYVWQIKIPKIEGWNNRLEILKSKGINHILVGAKNNTPRIKILGRKVWLCNNNIRVFDTPKKSYYGENAIQSRKSALNELLLIVGVLGKKLGITFKTLDFSFKKEHYALIKNDLAIEHNKKGEILRVSDEDGEWLLIDDSLGQGGELENTGKKAFDTNLPMQKWWNDKKEHGFKITDTLLLERLNQVTQNQLMFANNFESHVEAVRELSKGVKELRKEIKKINKSNS